MDITSLDFQQANIKQVLFKSRLRSVLYGVREADAALFSMQENPLGQWLYSVVKPKYSSYPEVREIERAMQQMMDAGRDLVTQYQRGRIEEARAGMDRVDTYANQITTLLQRLEKNIRTNTTV
ncbi:MULTISPECIES: hypothetical protein [Hymenobacter]|uniref:Uncharacterized protein n=1 Tax=Hymenobacter jejuensis TaxID=2502781 RepID=A0A5B7ZWC6_9BACT|nr:MULTISPECIES: hypothetical protein [Hymenobacter]MBC6988783.1 hypothetical protein [Hymenobacter sp. BT491]QDA58905.1 hypothetical protein FHG12_01775 [Hymenobacter jejuensis]